MSLIISFSKSITASTTEKTAVSQTKAGATGTLKKAFIHFPAGCDGKVHVKIFYNNIQIIPANSEGDIVGDDERIPLELNLGVISWPADFTLKAWNTDDKAHVVNVELVVETDRKINL